MSNAVATGAFPGMYEHVTKMGRVGKNHKGPHIGRNAGPQFRKLPYQDQPIQSPVPSSTPRRGSPVMRDIQRLPFLPLSPTRGIMKDLGMETNGTKKAEVVFKNEMNLNEKYIPMYEEVYAHYGKGPSAINDEQKKYKNKWVEVVNNKKWRKQDLDATGQYKKNDYKPVVSSNEKAGNDKVERYGSEKKISEEGDMSLKKKNDLYIKQEIKQKKYKEKWAEIVKKKEWKNRDDEDFEKVLKNKRNSLYEIENSDEKNNDKRRKTKPNTKKEIDENDNGEWLDDEGESIKNSDKVKKMDIEQKMRHKKYKSKWALVMEKRGKRNPENEDFETVIESKKGMEDSSDYNEIPKAEYSTGKRTVDEEESDVDDKTGGNDVFKGTNIKHRNERNNVEDMDAALPKGKASRKDHLRRRKNVSKPDPYLENESEQENGINAIRRATDISSEHEDVAKEEVTTGKKTEQEIADLLGRANNRGIKDNNNSYAAHVTNKKTDVNGKTDLVRDDNEEMPVYNMKQRSREKRRHSKKEDIVTQPRTRPAADSTPYVEMKLGRNMRAAPKGKLAAMSIDANTQDLIETLNRNNLTSLTQQTQQTEQTNLQEEQRRAAERQERLEASLRSLQEEERRRQDEEETREKQRKSEEEQKLARDFETKNTLLYDAFELTEPKTVVSPVMATPMMGVATPLMGVATPPPPADLYSSYRMTENYEQKSSEHVSTQPFSPHESTYFSRGGETTTTTTTSLKEDNSGFTGPKSAAVKREDSTDDNIEEIIEENNDKSDDDKIKDDDFDF